MELQVWKYSPISLFWCSMFSVCWKIGLIIKERRVVNIFKINFYLTDSRWLIIFLIPSLLLFNLVSKSFHLTLLRYFTQSVVHTSFLCWHFSFIPSHMQFFVTIVNIKYPNSIHPSTNAGKHNSLVFPPFNSPPFSTIQLSQFQVYFKNIPASIPRFFSHLFFIITFIKHHKNFQSISPYWAPFYLLSITGSTSIDSNVVIDAVEGYFDSKGGILASESTGVSLVIPKGALKSKQQIYFKVVQDKVSGGGGQWVLIPSQGHWGNYCGHTYSPDTDI